MTNEPDKLRVHIDPRTGERHVIRYVNDETDKPITDAEWLGSEWQEVSRLGDPGDVRRFVRIRARR